MTQELYRLAIWTIFVLAVCFTITTAVIVCNAEKLVKAWNRLRHPEDCGHPQCRFDERNKR